MMIPEQVKDYVLRKLLVQIQTLVNIATYKTRQITQRDVCDYDEIDVQIKTLKRILKNDLEAMRDPELTLSEVTKDKAWVHKKTIYNLKLNKAGCCHSCFIEKFAELGWKDPFPVEKEVFKSCGKVRPIVSFAFPSRRLMLNIIRACVGVTDPKKLWIH